MNEKEHAKSELAQKEEEVLKFWQENQIFEKSLNKPTDKGEFVFFEGPPTANAKPALHHLEARVFKDSIPRYKTMQGFHVRRKGGWDTHGLPVELQIEKKLGLKSKKEIETYGVEAFNTHCKDSVFEYIGEWEKFTDRIGYWVDKKNAYYTFDPKFMESVWNVVKTADDKKLLYKDYKVVPWCPRCGTALSSHELAQGYQDDKDLSVTAKFKIKGVENGYFLAWTTTPWTLPGNVALAVGNDIVYVEAKVGNEILVLAKDRLSVLPEAYEIIAEHKGSECVGMEYEPLYPFLAEKFSNKNQEAFAKAYKVYGADFVNTTDGTGIVHTAVMYGQDDFALGTQIGLPKFHLVNEEGHFFDDMGFLSSRFVKGEDVAVDIIKDLAHRGLLFKKEKYEHSYPHCWRCKTPLVYYARDSWYIRMSSLRDELVKENEGINWEPKHIKDGRFGEWLREVKDWAISRERYWGTPLPVWYDKEGNYKVIGGVEDLKKHTKKSGNTYFVMRHGETERNVRKLWSPDANVPDQLTEKGLEQIKESAKKLAGKDFDYIFVSPITRVHETGTLVAHTLGISPEKIIIDDRLREWNVGKEFSGRPIEDFFAVRNASADRYNFKTEDGESYIEIMKRSGEFIYDLESKYAGKTILIVSHGAITRALNIIAEGFSLNGLFERAKNFKNFDNAEVRALDFTPLPHNENYELDLHKPYIDAVELVDEHGDAMTRAKEVMDVWLDSGAMPFAQDHYPFENKEYIDGAGYPADFISEAIDQTRGWFYTLHAVGSIMGKGKAYKNVICLGHILDAEGKKMSKSIGNVLDPWLLMNKYGVDALRLWMYSVNQPGDSKNFDEKTVDEVVKKVFNPTVNILAFYEMYAGEHEVRNTDYEVRSENVLDRWIISRLNELIKTGTVSLEKYQVFEASRAIRDFVNDFSTWYVRRSRDRFKSDNLEEKKDALHTTGFVLREFAKYLAPFTPFFSESVYQKVKTENDPESVHLCEWPKAGEIEENVLSEMETVRKTVTVVLEARMSAGIKVRQPLASLAVKAHLTPELLTILAEEVNVKEAIVDENLETAFELDLEIDETLKNEGNVRDFIRAVQDARKTANLTPSEVIILKVQTNEMGRKFVEENAETIKKPTNVGGFEFGNANGEGFEVEGMKFKIEVRS